MSELHALAAEIASLDELARHNAEAAIDGFDELSRRHTQHELLMALVLGVPDLPRVLSL